eukprot:3424479-Pyramimonas_sp.AAC.1
MIRWPSSYLTYDRETSSHSCSPRSTWLAGALPDFSSAPGCCRAPITSSRYSCKHSVILRLPWSKQRSTL